MIRHIELKRVIEWNPIKVQELLQSRKHSFSKTSFLVRKIWYYSNKSWEGRRKKIKVAFTYLFEIGLSNSLTPLPLNLNLSADKRATWGIETTTDRGFKPLLQLAYLYIRSNLGRFGKFVISNESQKFVVFCFYKRSLNLRNQLQGQSLFFLKFFNTLLL